MDNQEPSFRNRYLHDTSKVFTQNAWDDVDWNKEQENIAKEKVEQNSVILFTESEIKELEERASDKWDEFYSIHQNKFFKDRHWLFMEFPELRSSPSSKKSEINEFEDELKRLRTGENFTGENSSFKVLEVGCGVGNSVFPILETNIDPNLFLYCCDFSPKAIDIVKESENYNPNRIRKALQNLTKYLKPGGVLLFRDYGRYDMAQLRFKRGRCLEDNFYARGDGTRCYFFTQDDVRDMMQEMGLEEVQNLVDRRLQVNRGKQLKMFRVWIQAKYRKPFSSDPV